MRRSRGLGDVYKRQDLLLSLLLKVFSFQVLFARFFGLKSGD
jgi:hypothetical protein